METDVPRHPEAEAVLAAEIADSTEPTPPETVAAPVRNRLVMAIKHKVSKSRQRFVSVPPVSAFPFLHVLVFSISFVSSSERRPVIVPCVSPQG